jgi:hypothetical protein
MVIGRHSLKLKKRGEFFVWLNYESAAAAAVRVCCEKHATSRINSRRTAPIPTFFAKPCSLDRFC